jgi:hypothetical protein
MRSHSAIMFIIRIMGFIGWWLRVFDRESALKLSVAWLTTAATRTAGTIKVGKMSDRKLMTSSPISAGRLCLCALDQVRGLFGLGLVPRVRTLPRSAHAQAEPAHCDAGQHAEQQRSDAESGEPIPAIECPA